MINALERSFRVALKLKAKELSKNKFPILNVHIEVYVP